MVSQKPIVELQGKPTFATTTAAQIMLAKPNSVDDRPTIWPIITPCPVFRSDNQSQSGSGNETHQEYSAIRQPSRQLHGVLVGTIGQMQCTLRLVGVFLRLGCKGEQTSNLQASTCGESADNLRNTGACNGVTLISLSRLDNGEKTHGPIVSMRSQAMFP